MNLEASCRVLELAENGALSWEDIARECIARMPEDDVEAMAHENDWLDEFDDDIEDEVEDSDKAEDSTDDAFDDVW